MKRLKRTNQDVNIRPNEMEFKLDLYFQHFTGQNLHSNLDNVLKMVMSDLTVSAVAPEPPKPKPKPTPPPPPSPRPAAPSPQKPMMASPQGVPRSSPARMTITPVSRQLTPQKQIHARQSPIRQPSPARQMVPQQQPRMAGMPPRPSSASPGRARGRPSMQQQQGMRMPSPGRGGRQYGAGMAPQNTITRG